MKVSFLVTYYNQREYVKQSLDSILAIKKDCEWEILVGDDGSNDGTVDEVARYIEQYPNNIKLFVMPREKGKKYDAVRRASANRLNILGLAEGDFFCTLDGDDCYCDTEFIKEALEIFRDKENVSVVGFGFKYVKDDVCVKETILPSKFTLEQIPKKSFLENYYLHAGGCVYRNNYGKDRLEYMKMLGFFDDNNIVVNSLNFGEMFVVNRPIYAYRQTGQSIYTSMDSLEQATLDVQGMDVDLRLVSGALENSVKKRYAPSVILMYIWRNRIREILGEEKCLRYESGCSSLIPSYCYDLLHFRELSKARKKDIKSFLKLGRKCVLKQSLKFFLKRIIE